MPEYAERNIMHPPLRDHYTKHLSAMTGEGLHSKADIAAELAYRDARIEELETAGSEVTMGFAIGEDLDVDHLRELINKGAHP